MKIKQLTTNLIIISIYSNWTLTNHLILIRDLSVLIYIYTLCTCSCTTIVKCITIVQSELLNTLINNREHCIIKIGIVITDLLITFEVIGLYSDVKIYRKIRWRQMTEARLIEIYSKFMTICVLLCLATMKNTRCNLFKIHIVVRIKSIEIYLSIDLF